MLRRSGRFSVVIAFTLFLGSGAHAQKPAKPRLDKYQVAAGSLLQARLVSPLDSATARVNDQVDAKLADAVKQDGTELIPAGSVILGKVVNVVPASRRNLFGQVVITFSVIEHAGTGSRAAIETESIVLRAAEIRDSEDRRAKKRPVDARFDPPQLLSVRLAEPLVVYIPQ